jgi:hypothetical protein
MSCEVPDILQVPQVTQTYPTCTPGPMAYTNVSASYQAYITLVPLDVIFGEKDCQSHGSTEGGAACWKFTILHVWTVMAWLDEQQSAAIHWSEAMGATGDSSLPVL